MRGNSQNGGQTTKSLLIKPQCSGVPIQQAVSLSSSFPRHCLLFVCAFFRKMQAGSWSEELPLPPVSCIQNRPGFHHGNRGGSFALWVLFSGAHAKPCEGAFGKPRVCGEKARTLIVQDEPQGSPPRMRGKGQARCEVVVEFGITPAYAGKSGGGRYHVNINQGSPPRMRGKD